MTTRDFIAKCVRGEIRKNKTVSSVVYDAGLEVIYSYGSHYPLLFKIKDRWILNDHGYSNTTAKQINHASPYADYVVDLNNSGRGGYGYHAVEPTAENVAASVDAELDEIRAMAKAIKRRGTKKEAALWERADKIAKTAYFLRMNADIDPEDIPF